MRKKNETEQKNQPIRQKSPLFWRADFCVFTIQILYIRTKKQEYMMIE